VGARGFLYWQALAGSELGNAPLAQWEGILPSEDHPQNPYNLLGNALICRPRGWGA